MPYSTQRKYKSEWPTPEEEQVLAALARYCFDPEQTTVNDFTPTRVLFDVYTAYADQFDYIGSGSEFPEKLTETQFGAALRRVFHLEEDRKCRRRVKGERAWGYYFVKGPGSIRVNSGPGNPTFKQREAKCNVEANTEKTSGLPSTLAPLGGVSSSKSEDTTDSKTATPSTLKTVDGPELSAKATPGTFMIADATARDRLWGIQ